MNPNTMKIIIGIVMIAVAFILFPLVLDGADEIRTATNGTVNATALIDNYTGLSSVVAIGPTLVFVALLFGGAIMGILGVRGRSGGGG